MVLFKAEIGNGNIYMKGILVNFRVEFSQKTKLIFSMLYGGLLGCHMRNSQLPSERLANNGMCLYESKCRGCYLKYSI